MFKILFLLLFPLYLQAVIVVPEPSETWKLIQDLILGKDRMVIMTPKDPHDPFNACVLVVRTTDKKEQLNTECIQEKLHDEFPCYEVQVTPIEQNEKSLTCEWSVFACDCVRDGNRYIEMRKEIMHGFLKAIETEESTIYYEYRTTEMEQVDSLRDIILDSFSKL